MLRALTMTMLGAAVLVGCGADDEDARPAATGATTMECPPSTAPPGSEFTPGCATVTIPLTP